MRSPWFSRLFIGPQGLRSGWGLLLYLLIFAVSICIVQVAAKLSANINPAYLTAREQAQAAMLGREAMRPGSMLVVYGTALVVTLLVAWIMSRIERRRSGVYGLGGSHRIRDFAMACSLVLRSSPCWSGSYGCAGCWFSTDLN